MSTADPTSITLRRRRMSKAVYAVEIVEDATGEVIKRIPYATRMLAEKGERGVLINLNHASFSTRVVPEKKKCACREPLKKRPLG